MTCIAGIAQNGHVWLGGDSGTCKGNLIQIDEMPKVFRRGEFIIGTTGDACLSDIMRFVLPLPRLSDSTSLDAFMVKRFAKAMRKCFESCDYPTEVENGEAYDGEVLVGVRGRLYEVDANFAISRVACGFNAIGSGSEAALGVLHVNDSLDPWKRVEQALEVSAKIYSTVSAPFVIRHI